jgi:hypothetical protein
MVMIGLGVEVVDRMGKGGHSGLPEIFLPIHSGQNPLLYSRNRIQFLRPPSDKIESFLAN